MVILHNLRKLSRSGKVIDLGGLVKGRDGQSRVNSLCKMTKNGRGTKMDGKS